MRDDRIIDEYGQFDPAKAARHFGPFARFKGDDPPSSGLPQTKTSRYTRQQLYPLLQQAMSGQGILPGGLAVRRKENASQGLLDAFSTARSDLQSELSRTLRPGDIGPQQYLMAAMDRNFLSQKDDLRRGFHMEDLTDKDLGMSLTATAIGNEKRMGVNAMQTYNQAMAQNMDNQARFGTFETNLMGNLGEATMNLYFAKRMGG